MHRKLLCLLCLLLAIGGGGHVMAQSADTSAGIVDGVVRVKLQREVASRIQQAVLPMSAGGVVTTGITPLDRTNQKVRAVSMKRVFPYSPKFEEKHKQYGLDLWYDITFESTDMKPAQVSNLYKQTAGISYAGQVLRMKPIGGERFRVLTAEEMAKATQAAPRTTMPFNDPLLPQQWHYNNDGSIAGTVAGADINLFEAWQTGVTGSDDVLVAIIDGGFQVDHPDLQQNAFINEAELYGQPGVDDDGNGFVDDVYGYNFVINSGDVSAHSHGTHVAGTVGAVNNNGIGVAGVAGGNGTLPGVKMLVCQIFDSRASNLAANYARAIVYAADMDASIAQCSWGYDQAGLEDPAVTEAIDYFMKEGGGKKMNGGLCIFSAGNTGDEGNYFPGYLPQVVSVASMTAEKTPAYYSTRGSWVDVTAPGGLLDYGQQYGVLSTLPNSTYGYNEGTSMACPHVSGIAALILSKYGNEQFSNETLRTLLTSSVNDLYSTNPDYVGLFGSGYIDAYKALQVSQGSTPEAVADFNLTPSHDNVLIEWTIPQTDEGVIDHHVIYYSTEPFTAASDLSKLNSISVDTKFQSSGDAAQYELEGLQPTTTYYFAIVAYNRWGTGSALSPVKEATTNEGPKLSLDKTTLNLTVNAANSNVGTGELTVSNTGKGLLKYSLSAATRSVTPATRANGKVNPGNVVAHDGQIYGKSITESEVVSADYQATEWPKNMTWGTGLYASIGESDLQYPNAMAQYFSVSREDYPNGFNLTGLKFGGASGKDGGNPVIEIYDGSRAISTASLITTVDYSYFSYNNNVNLSEQIYFKPGSSFWVVAKFSAGVQYPLGISKTNASNIKQYSYFSIDNGATWSQLSESLGGSNYESIADQLTWDVTAVSNNPDWSAVLNPEPIEGQVRPGESQVITMKNDGQQLVNGTYRFNLYLNTNETQNAKEKVTVNMTVSGYQPKLSSQQLINFGDLLVGQSKSLTVELVNSGYGIFAGQYGPLYPSRNEISCTSNQFEMPAQVTAISARSKGTVTITFKPTKAGSMSGTVTLKDKNGVTYSFTVRGVASDPAKLAIDNTELEFGDLETGGEEKTQSFTIKNEGAYPLQYVFPKYSTETIEGVDNAHKFGYTYLSNLNGSDGFAYDNNPELSSETDITSFFNDNNWQSDAISLGFDFPFYGTNYDQVYVTSYGSVIFNKSSYYQISCMVPTASCVDGLGYISAYVNSGKMTMGNDSKVTYGKMDGKFVVKFKNVQSYSSKSDGSWSKLSFHMTLSPNGDVEIFYDDYTPSTVLNRGLNNFVGISDVNCEDPFVITDADLVHDTGSELYKDIQTGSAFKIVAPSKSMIKSISSTSGFVGIGESKEITITAAANDDLYAGELQNVLTLISNDPENPSVNLTLKANIVGDGLQPDAVLDATSVDFGRVFRTSVAKRSILLSNKGRNTLTVSSVTLESGNVQLEDELNQPFTIAAGQGKDIVVTLPTDNEGEVSDKITINYADGTSATIAVTGTVIGVPQWSLTPEAIDVTTPYGTNVAQDLTIANQGNETLEFNIESASWFKYTDLIEDDKTTIGYNFKSSSEHEEVAYDWEDISKNYDAHQTAAYYIDNTDYYTAELPFEFPFYGKKYNKIYIFNTGFISFTEPETDYKNFPEPPALLPTTETFYTNIIAPFWGMHSMGSSSTEGTFYKVEDDHVVVSYLGYANSVMVGMNFQVLLYKDGTFKFQYKVDEEGLVLNVYGLCGIQDETGTRGVHPAQQYIAGGNALLFTPNKSFTVPAGEQITVPVELQADQMADTYDYTMTMNTNVPTASVVELPIKMTITGEAKPVFPESVGGEAVADAISMPQLNYDFQVVNEGSKAFKITGASFDEEYQYNNAALLVYTTYEDEWMGGITTGWTQYFPGLEITVGKEPVDFRVVVYDDGIPMTIESPITLTLEGLDDMTEKVIPFKLELTEAPAMVFDKESISIDGVAGDYKGTESLTIKNEGAYKLTYSLRLDPSGRDEVLPETEDGGGDIGPMLPMNYAPNANTPAFAKAFADSAFTLASSLAPTTKAYEDEYVYDVPQGGEFTNLLYYPMAKPWTSANSVIMGTGNNALNENFYAATRYVSPAEGFNLSHLYFVGTVGTLEDVDIEASVVLGDDVTANRVIARGKVHVDKEEPNQSGHYFGTPRILEFDAPVFVNPADTFYVVLKYPAGYSGSALVASRDGDMSTNRCMAYLNSMGGWFDLEDQLDQAYGYGAMGYFMTCVETNPGSAWIKLLNNETEGEIAVGEELGLNFEIDAAKAYFDKENQATLVIKSNDPTQKLVNYHITLDRNGAPVVTVPNGTITVPEASTANVALTVADTEGEAFTVSVADESGIATIGDCLNAEGTQEGITVDGNTVSVAEGQSLKLNLRLAPDYGTAGQHSLTVTATDASGNSAVTTVVYNVELTNRAPEYRGPKSIVVAAGSTTPVYFYDELFADPEEDEMTYAVSSADRTIADIYNATNGFVLSGVKIGNTTVSVTATDANGNATKADIEVKVADPTGIGSTEAGTEGIAATITDGDIIVTTGSNADKADIRVYDAAGVLVANKAAINLRAGSRVAMGLKGAPNGVYNVVATLDGKDYCVKVIK